MALEDLTGSAKFIDDLNAANPVGSTDEMYTIDEHIRGIKNVLGNTFPNVTGAITSTHGELNLLDGISDSLVHVGGGQTIGGQTTFSSYAPVIMKGASADYVYMSWYADAAAQTTRSAFIGYGSPGNRAFTIYNDLTDEDINLRTQGTGQVTWNGNEVVTVAGGQTLASDLETTGTPRPWGSWSAGNAGFNVVQGLLSSATWLITGTSGGVHRGGVQLLDTGAEVRLYVDGTGNYLSLDNSGVATVDGAEIITDAGGQTITGQLTLGTEKDQDARLIVATGNATAGQSGVIAGRYTKDAGVLHYGTYWAYDAYWDEDNDLWYPIRTDLGNKFKVEMGYHLNEFKISTKATVAASWADSDWTDLLNLDGSGNLSIAGTVDGRDIATDGVALDALSGAEANPAVVPQAEAEAGTATTERTWTAQRVGQAIIALGSGSVSETVFTDLGYLSVTSGAVILDSAWNTLVYTRLGDRCRVQGTLLVDSIVTPSGNLDLDLPYTVYSGAADGGDDFVVSIVVTNMSAANFSSDFVGILPIPGTALGRIQGYSYTSSTTESLADCMVIGTMLQVCFDFLIA